MGGTASSQKIVTARGAPLMIGTITLQAHAVEITRTASIARTPGRVSRNQSNRWSRRRARARIHTTTAPLTDQAAASTIHIAVVTWSGMSRVGVVTPGEVGAHACSVAQDATYTLSTTTP